VYDENAGGNGWNMIGNPYPCPIDWDYIDDNSDIGAAYFLIQTNSYGIGKYVNQVNGISSDGINHQYIPSMQGFIVNTDVTKDLVLTNACRTVTNNAMKQGIYNYEKTNRNNNIPFLRLSLYSSVNTALLTKQLFILKMMQIMNSTEDMTRINIKY